MSEFTQAQPPPIKMPPPVPRGAKPKRKLSTSALVAITAVTTAVLISLCWALVFIAFNDISEILGTDTPPFYISAESPELVELGDQCVITVKVSNESDKKYTLSYLDIMDSLLDGFEVVSVHPKPKSKSNAFGIYSYHSKHRLEPDEEATFKFTLKAKEIGEWSSTIDACNAMHEYVSDTVEIEVVEKGGIAKRAEDELDDEEEPGEVESEEADEEISG